MKPIALVNQSIRPVIAELAFDNASNMFVLGRQEAMGAEIDIVGEISSEELHNSRPGRLKKRQGQFLLIKPRAYSPAITLIITLPVLTWR